MDKDSLSVLMIGHYPVDQLNSAPKLRTYSLWKSLAELVDLDFITGYREQRRRALWGLIFSGKWRQYRFVYIESATSTAMEADIVLLCLLCLWRIPVGIYIRDAYPMFALSPTDSLKNRILNWGWFISHWFYQRWAAVNFFPTASLAKYFHPRRTELLPPAGRPLVESAPPGPYGYVLYAGAIAPDSGSQELFPAFAKVYAQMPEFKLLVLAPTHLSQIDPQWRSEPWLIVREGVLTDLMEQWPLMACAVIPRPKTFYNDLALPIKLFDYLSLGLPVVSTDCQEIVTLMADSGAVLTTQANPDSLADGLLTLLSDPERLKEMGQNALAFIRQGNAWADRAQQIVNVMMDLQ